ncbi:MAG TPA: N-formylglutamate amidohydrolase [Methanoregula sp.]|nr:N-formylglutamate amidohydrolase [Methanoregula sp.]
MQKNRYPFLISVPHGGTEVPGPVRPRLLLSDEELRYYCDPQTRVIFGFKNRVAAYIDTPVSRMVVDLNRPPLPLPLRDPDGIIKLRTIDGREVWRPGQVPDMRFVHGLLMAHYFPFHQQVDELIDLHHVRIAFDCHSMLPHGSEQQKDAGKARPLICLSNNGDLKGRAKKGGITTCSEEWVAVLAGAFREEFSLGSEVAVNNPFSGGFISNAHYWHKGIPWIQIEVNRALYEPADSALHPQDNVQDRVLRLREKIWKVLTLFWERTGDGTVS